MGQKCLLRLLPPDLWRAVYVEAARQGVAVQDVIIQDVRMARASKVNPPKRRKRSTDQDGLIRRLVEDPEPDPEILEMARETPGFFSAFMLHILPMISSTPACGHSLLDVAERLVEVPCDLVLVIGQRGYVYRQLGAPEKELQELEWAADLAGGCRSCQAHLKRRRAKANAVLGEVSLALAEADGAIELYEAVKDQPHHHDVFGDGLARAFLARADVRHCLGVESRDHKLLSGAVEDVATALGLLVPAASPKLYRIAVFNLTRALHATGKHEDLELANQHLTTARKLFMGSERRTTERGWLVWGTAMVRYELGKVRPKRIREMLDEALTTFLYLGMPFEVCAVAADRMRIAYPDRGLIGDLASKVSRRLEARLEQLRECEPETWEKLGDVEPLRQALGWVTDAARHCGLEIVRDTVDDLRDACGSGMLKCLIRWRES